MNTIQIIRAKLHGIYITGCELNYHGSITLDPDICENAGIFPMEFVEIWNKNNGERISTYVIFGERGSKCCVLNGAAARTCQKGDELIIAASVYCTEEQIPSYKPIILTFNSENNIEEKLQYVVDKNDNIFNFSIKNIK